MFQNHLLEACLTQDWKTMALQNLTIVDLLYFIMCEDPIQIEVHWNNIWLRACDHTTWLSKCSRTAFRHFFWVLTISWSWLLAWVWIGPFSKEKLPFQNFLTLRGIYSWRVELSYHVQTNISVKGALLKALAHLVYIRERYCFLQCGTFR